MPPNNSILVLGAGELGLSVLHALSAHPSHPSLTVLLRPSTLTNPSPTQRASIVKIHSLGISTLPGDILQSSDAELATLFTPFHTIISCTGMTAPPGTQVKLCRAVLAARTPRYLPWQYGVDYDVIGRGSSQDLFSEQLDVRDLLRGQSETRWVVVSTGVFMSFLVGEGFGVVGEGEGGGKVVRALGGWGNRVTGTGVGDIGRVVAEVVCAAPEVHGVIHIAGETVSYARLAEIVEKVTGREVKREEWGVEMLKRELAAEPADGLRKYRVVFGEGKGVWWDEEATWNVQRGMKLKGVEECLRESMNV